MKTAGASHGPAGSATVSIGRVNKMSRFLLAWALIYTTPAFTAAVLDAPITPDPQGATEDAPYNLDVSGNFSSTLLEALDFGATGLPPSLSINSNSGVISGTPTNADALIGSFNVTVTATDSESAANDTFTLNVENTNDAPVLDSAIPDQNAQEDSPFNLDVSGNFSDPDGDSLDFSASGLPANLSINQNSGVISGTPTNADVAGSPYSVTVTATDPDNASANDTFTLTVQNTNDAPVLDSAIPNQNAQEDSPFNLDVSGNFSDPDGDALTFGAVGLAPSLSISPAGGISGTPTDADVAGSPYSVTVTATDPGGLSADDTFTLTVENINDAPVLDSAIPNQTAAEDSPFNLNVSGNFSDPDGDNLDFNASGLPASLSINQNSGVISGTPTNEDVAGSPYSVTVTATDPAGLSTDGTFSLTVQNTNDAPVLDSAIPNQNAQEDAAFNLDVSGNFSDPDGDALTFGASGLAPSLSISPAGTISGTPTDADVAGSPYSITVTATDPGGLSADDTFTLSVENINDAPVLDSAIPDQNAPEDALFNLDISGNFSDPDPDDELTYAAVGLPENLSLDEATGVVSGTPTDADVAGSPYSVTVTATDPAGLSAEDTFSLTVANVNDAPVLDAPIADQTAIEDTPLTFNVAGNFSDEDGDTLIFDAQGLPPGFAIDPATGEISGTADDVAVLAIPTTLYEVLVTATDPTGLSAEASFMLTVENVNDLPLLAGQVPDPIPTDEDVDVQITPLLLTIEDPDPGDVFIVQLTAGENYTLIGDGDRVLPDPDYSGPLTVPTTVQDLAGGVSNAIDLLITVNPINDPPVGTPIDPQTATENVPFTLDVAPFFDDVDSEELSFTATGLPPGLTSDTAGLISGVPTLEISVGEYVVELTVSDGTDTLVTSFPLNVLEAGRADLAVDILATPSAAVINNSTDWTISITNNAPEVNVANIAVNVVFSGEVPFALDEPADPGCTNTSATEVDCTVNAGLAGGASTSLTISGRGDQVGDVVADVTVSIPDPEPLDETPGNDVARGTLSLAESLSAGAAQQLDSMAATASVIGDFDGDGFNDLAVGTGAGQRTFIHLNIVDPLDENKRTLDPQGLARGAAAATADVTTADLDGDGDLDLVTANGAGVANEVLLNDGGANFPDSLLLGTAAATSNAVAVSDINGDGFPDLVFANASPNPVFTSVGGVSFDELPPGLGDAASVDVAAADLFLDGFPELVFANGDGDAAIYRNTSGQFAFDQTLPTGPTSAVSTGDFNGDGLVDLVFGAAVSVPPALPGNPVFQNDGNGGFTLIATLGASPTGDVIATDVNLDGLLDVVAINNTGAHQIYVGDGLGGFTLNPEQFAAPGASGGGFGDLNGDGRADLAASGANGSGVFLNDGFGNLGPGDLGAPTITLVGPAEINLDVEAEYIDEGATATDAVDGDITERIVVDNPVDTAVVGTYTVSYDVVDSSGNTAVTVTRTVRVGVRTGTGGGGGGSVGLAFSLLLLLALLARGRSVAPRRRI